MLQIENERRGGKSRCINWLANRRLLCGAVPMNQYQKLGNAQNVVLFIVGKPLLYDVAGMPIL
jgi:hypothetical protein